MTNWRNFYKPLWFTITLSIVLCFSALFIGLYWLVFSTGQRAFYVTLTHNVPVVAPDGTVTFRQIPDNDERVRVVPINPLQQKFEASFRQSLLLVGMGGLLLAIILGYLLARFFTDPLRKVTAGMRQLRQQTYKLSLQPTGTPEIDDVINEFNALTKKLHQAEELRRNLISDTAHELNTPLTSLRVQLEGVKDGVLKANPERVDTLLQQVDRLQTLTEALQEYAHLRSSQYHLRRKRVELHALVEKVVRTFHDELTGHKVSVTNALPQDLIIRADPKLLERVWANLIQNTLRYAQATHIQISGNESELIFADNGVGVAKKHWPLLFERFYRVEPSRNRKTGGLGLGLAMVKEIVEAHGWRIKAGRPADGKGLAFHITL